MKYALGIIETVGLAAAIQAADAAVKSANVRLIGYENSKGDGFITVKVEGDVGAVKAAIDAARMSASLVSKVHGYRVIPRPSDGIEMLVYNKSTVGYTKSSPPQETQPVVSEAVEAPSIADEPSEDIAAVSEPIEDNIEVEDTAEAIAEPEALEVEEEASTEVETTEDESEEAFDEDSDGDDEVCNICKDPACTRKKGELRRFCIHYYDNK